MSNDILKENIAYLEKYGFEESSDDGLKSGYYNTNFGGLLSFCEEGTIIVVSENYLIDDDTMMNIFDHYDGRVGNYDIPVDNFLDNFNGVHFAGPTNGLALFYDGEKYFKEIIEEPCNRFYKVIDGFEDLVGGESC